MAAALFYAFSQHNTTHNTTHHTPTHLVPHPTQPDLSKGSFYANPEVECPAQVTPADATSYPEYCRPNIWPTQHLPSLQHACQQAGMVAIDAGYLLARSIDSFLQHTRKQHAGGVDGPSLEGLLRASQCHKGRLLHYFPPSTSDDGVHDDSWCGWHFDHSALTGVGMCG